MDLVGVIFFLCALEGYGNLCCNKQIRVWITEQNCDPLDRESEPIVCIGGYIKKFGFVFMQSIHTKVCVCIWERLIN